jgi:flagellar biosynthesis protein FlhG
VKPLSEQDHYEVLEVPRDCGPERVELAYRLARATWAEDALASYSIFGAADVAALRERVETAYRVLSDGNARRAYDDALRAEPHEELVAPRAPAPAAPPTPAARAAALESFEEIAEEPEGPFDGARLRRTRLRRGLEVADLARITKINPSYLRFLEEERFDALPARVYVRGFVTLYARCVGLDPKPVAEDYMRRFDAFRGPARRRAAKG